MPEILDLYDENRKLIGKTHVRGVPIKEGTFYLVADIWTVTFDGYVLIDKRHPSKPFGGMWECTGGAVTAGEDSVTGAIRELEEELGIKAGKDELRLIDSCRCLNKFVDTYLLRKNIDIHALRLQKDEVTEAKLVTFSELEKLIENKQLSISSGRFNEYKAILMEYAKSK